MAHSLRTEAAPSPASETPDLAPEDRVSEIRPISTPMVRIAALELINESRAPWKAEDFARWCRRRLIETGLLPVTSRWLWVWEPGAPRVALPTQEEPLDRRTAAAARQVLELGRGAAVSALRGWVESPRQEVWISAARRAGRVRRDSAMGEWYPVLGEGQTLSQWVLALVASDLLDRRAYYEERLSVCDVCGSLAFRRGGPRTRCPSHQDEPEGV